MDDKVTSKELGVTIKRTVIKVMLRSEFLDVRLLPEIIKTQSWHLLGAEGATHVEMDQLKNEVIFVKYEAIEEEKDVPIEELDQDGDIRKDT